MNIVRLFTRDEPIAGLEISDACLRLALLEPSGDNTIKTAKLLIEEPLPPEIIAGGIILDQEKFSSSLKNLVKKASIKLHYVVVSVPTDIIYSRLFSFPKAIQGSKMEETMKLAVGFQLPVKLDDVYLDWEKIEEAGQNKVLLASVLKTIIDSYLVALHAIKLNPIAVEFHPLSFIRVIDIPEANSVLLKASGEMSNSIFIVKNHNLMFSRVLPERFFAKEKLNEEIDRIVNFYEAENEKISVALNLEECGVSKNYVTNKKEIIASKWMVSIGAAVRGLIPRSKDDLVSLMPMSTLEAIVFEILPKSHICG